MIDLTRIPSDKKSLDMYEVQNTLQSWSYQKDTPLPRVVDAAGMRFTTEDGRELLDFSSCFVSHNIGHKNPKVIEAICRQARKLASVGPRQTRQL